MILIYIFSILSLSSLFMEKPQPIEIKPAEENNMIEVKTVKPQKIQKSDSKISELEKNKLLDENLEETEISDTQEDDEYEEIIFQDDFDKEYRMGTEDNYLEE